MIFFRKIRFGKLADSELLTGYLNSGETEYLGELFSRYSHLVYGVCLNYLKSREDAKDAVLTIFGKLTSLLRVKKVEKFRQWLYSVTRNYCLILIRSRRRALRREGIFMEDADGFDFQPGTGENGTGDLLFNLAELLETLSPEQKTCIELFYLKGKSYSEISELTGFQGNHVKSCLQNGKRNLRITIQKKYGNE